MKHVNMLNGIRMFAIVQRFARENQQRTIERFRDGTPIDKRMEQREEWMAYAAFLSFIAIIIGLCIVLAEVFRNG